MKSKLLAGGACVLAIVASYPVVAAPPPGTTKPVVRTQDDLPRHTYAVPGTAVGLFNADDATFDVFADRVIADVDATLAGYDIQDRATLRDLLGERLSYEELHGQNEKALATIAQIRALEDKPDAKLMSGLRLEAILKARMTTKTNTGPAFEKAYAANYAAALDALPWAVVGNRVKEDRQRTAILTPALAQGIVERDLGPAVAKDHQLSSAMASEMLRIRAGVKTELPLSAPSLAVLNAVVAKRNVMKPDIWAARDVTLTAADHVTPVVVGIWDSGSDLALFPTQTYTDPHPVGALPYNAHGLAFDLENRPEAGWLRPLTPEQQKQYPTLVADLQGFNDLQQAINTPAAAALQAKFKAMPSEKVPAYFELLDFFGGYLHGTHVAGIVARGNPAVRLAVSRITFDERAVPNPPTDARLRRQTDAYRTSVAWFRSHRVRVVNMSWGGGPSGYEHDLEVNGIGKDATERKKLARHYFEMDRDGLFAALKSAPEILFVCAGGNENSDSSFGEFIPASFELPNLLTVSAVDRGGDEASFTSYGKTVVVSANGYQVDSLIPGGGHLLDSGTSMASPNVANLAAKLIALDPSLTPEKTIALIRAGATTSEDGRRHNINPKATVALLRK